MLFRNILVDGKNAFIGDLGFVRIEGTIKKDERGWGSLHYKSPECLNLNEITCATDIW